MQDKTVCLWEFDRRNEGTSIRDKGNLSPVYDSHHSNDSLDCALAAPKTLHASNARRALNACASSLAVQATPALDSCNTSDSKRAMGIELMNAVEGAIDAPGGGRRRSADEPVDPDFSAVEESERKDVREHERKDCGEHIGEVTDTECVTDPGTERKICSTWLGSKGKIARYTTFHKKNGKQIFFSFSLTISHSVCNSVCNPLSLTLSLSHTISHTISHSVSHSLSNSL